MLSRSPILATMLAVVLLTTSAGIPSVLHRCLDVTAQCESASCCVGQDVEKASCCDGESDLAAPSSGAEADDACCIEQVVIHVVHTTAVPAVSVEAPTVGCEDRAWGSDRPVMAMARSASARIALAAITPPSPPPLPLLGALLI
ncbi:MAG: hypothetical protein FGM24_08725 [Candidatus Kapabacteria bacterium]|nr:hypothetical protein [Candidatus Kapabacteria bacterium]